MAIIPSYRPTNYGSTGMGGGELSLHDSALDVQNLQNQGAERQLKQKQAGDSALLQQQEAIKQRRLQMLMPMLNQGGGGFGGAPGGTNTPKPGITVGGVYSPDQLQTQVNLARGQGDQNAATQVAAAKNQMAGRGMSTGSPLMMALQNQIQAANNQTNAGNETQLRTNAAEANAKQQTSSEGLRNTQWQQDNALDIERRRQQAAASQSYMSILAGLLG
jgi:hypothetical protein